MPVDDLIIKVYICIDDFIKRLFTDEVQRCHTFR
jgi:hypothetical protein